MTVTPRFDEVTPVIEMEALKKRLSGLIVHANTYDPTGRTVPVAVAGVDFTTLSNANYPGVYLTYANVTRATEREVRGPTNLQYAPPGLPTSVQVPADMDAETVVGAATVDWGVDGFDRLSSPYYVEDHPIPYNLEFNIAVLTRNYQQTFEIINQLQQIDRIPERFGGLEVPEDGTVRYLELIGGPETSVIKDEAGKGLVQTLYSVRVAAELRLFEVEQFSRASDIRITTLNVTLPAEIPYL